MSNYANEVNAIAEGWRASSAEQNEYRYGSPQRNFWNSGYHAAQAGLTLHEAIARELGEMVAEEYV
jgi:hypothetical protein